MAVTKEYLNYVAELFEPVGTVRIRRMFGGAGVFLHDAMFAIVDDERIYLKVDDTSRPEFVEDGLAPFTYEKKDGEQAIMSYYTLPETAYDDSEELRIWALKGVDAALRAQKAKAPKSSTKKSIKKTAKNLAKQTVKKTKKAAKKPSSSKKKA